MRFADSSPDSVVDGELHANFSLSGDGEYLGLVGADGGNLARGGERLSLVTPDGANILAFTHSRLWHPHPATAGRR